MVDQMVRKCGSGWAYCDGECNVCMEPNIIITNRTDDCCMANNTNGYVYMIDSLSEYRINSDRISEAVERTKKYIKE